MKKPIYEKKIAFETLQFGMKKPIYEKKIAILRDVCETSCV